jgi:hypothetical protein
MANLHDYSHMVYKRHSELPLTHIRPHFASTPEQLMGTVNGIAANQFEERLGKALTERKIPYYFRYAVGAPKGFPGWKEIDFVTELDGQAKALAVDGMDFVHKGARAQAQDKLNDIIIQKSLESYGYTNIGPVEHISTARLTTQQDAHQVVREIFG